MHDLLAEFLRHLAIEKRSSPLTVKSYREDLTQAVEQFARLTGGAKLTPERLTTRLVRAYIAWLSTKGYARTTVARRLAASARIFARNPVPLDVDLDSTVGIRGWSSSDRVQHVRPVHLW